MIRTIDITLNDGNMGDGWADDYAAACAYAEFLRTYLPANGYPDAIVDVSVSRRCTGSTRIHARDKNGSEIGEYFHGLQDIVGNVAWVAFCESHEASLLAAEA